MDQHLVRMAFDEYLEKVRQFTREILRPNEYRLEAENAIPEEIVQGIRDIGLFAISIPREYGGLGLTMEQQVGREGDLVPFLRYAYSDRGLNGIRQNVSTGILDAVLQLMRNVSVHAGNDALAGNQI